MITHQDLDSILSAASFDTDFHHVHKLQNSNAPVDIIPDLTSYFNQPQLCNSPLNNTASSIFPQETLQVGSSPTYDSTPCRDQPHTNSRNDVVDFQKFVSQIVTTSSSIPAEIVVDNSPQLQHVATQSQKVDSDIVSKKYNYTCNTCQKGFKLLASLRRHQLEHISYRRYPAARISSDNNVLNGFAKSVSTPVSNVESNNVTLASRQILDREQFEDGRMPKEENVRFHKSIRRKWNALVMDRMSILAFSQQLKKTSPNVFKAKTKRVN